VPRLTLQDKENKIVEILPFREKAKIIFTAGKYLGEKGTIEKIDEKKGILIVRQLHV
jgi:ribosomal protein S4E